MLYSCTDMRTVGINGLSTVHYITMLAFIDASFVHLVNLAFISDCTVYGIVQLLPLFVSVV